MVVGAQDLPDDEVEGGEVEVGEDDVVAVIDHVAEGFNRYLLELLLEYLEVEDVDGVEGQRLGVAYHLQWDLLEQRLEDLEDYDGDRVGLGRVQLDRLVQLLQQQCTQLIGLVLEQLSPVPHDLSDQLEGDFLFLRRDQQFDGEPVEELVVCIFEEEGVLAVYVVGEVADGFDAEYLDGHVVCGVVLVEQTLILGLLVNAVDVPLVVEALTQVVHDVLDHHDLQLNLLPDQVQDVLEGPSLVLERLELLVLEYVETDQQDFLPEVGVALLAGFVAQDVLLEQPVDGLEVLEIVGADDFQGKDQLPEPVALLSAELVVGAVLVDKLVADYLAQPALDVCC